MVAVRTNGLALESIVGVLTLPAEGNGGQVGGATRDEKRPQALVSETYLDMLVRLANGRFAENASRMARFAAAFEDAMREDAARGAAALAWEDKEARRRRKREEGLRMRQEVAERERTSGIVGRAGNAGGDSRSDDEPDLSWEGVLTAWPT